MEQNGTVLLLIKLGCLTLLVNAQCGSDDKLQKEVQDLVRNENYDGSSPPKSPTNVSLQLFLRDVSGINEIDRNVALLLSFRQTWSDRRLRIAGACQNSKILVSEKEQYKLWVPSTRVENAISVGTVTAPLEMKAFYIFPDTGTVVMRWNAEMTFPCTTDYAKFPFDQIVCDIGIGKWNGARYFNLTIEPVLRRRHFRLSTFRVEKFHPPVAIPLPYDEAVFGLQIRLRRYYIFYILQIFIPNLLTVIISFLAFLFPIESFRVSLLLSTLITAALQYNAVASSLPRVGYLKGVDVWLLGCVTAIFAGLLGNSFLCMLSKRAEGSKEETIKLLCFSVNPKSLLPKLDRILMCLFVILFSVFVIVYFAVFVSGGDREAVIANDVE